MDIHELRRRKKQLRFDLARAIYVQIEQFKRDTGVSVCALDADFEDATDFTDGFPQWVLKGLDVTLDMAEL